MTDRRALLVLVAGKSPAAQDRALQAMRALEVGSPVVDQRIARVAAEALRDPSVVWTDDERQQLADAAGMTLAGHQSDESARARLSALVGDWEAAGRSQAAFARDVLARDADNLTDWLGGRSMPRALADWLTRVVAVRIVDEQVVVTVEPRALEKRGRKPGR